MKKYNTFLIFILVLTSLSVFPQNQMNFQMDLIPQSVSGPLFANDSGAFTPHITNVTIGEVGDDDVRCIAIGDADNDGDNDIVVGTAACGGLFLYENIGNSQAVQFQRTQLANFSWDTYFVYPSYVNDVVIADIEGTGNNSILVGTWYYNSGDKGDVVRFDKNNSVWQRTEVLNGVDPIPGGVYSICVGEVGSAAEQMIVVGQGGRPNLNNCNVTVYQKELGAWSVEDIVINIEGQAEVCIGDYNLSYDGNEIVYCSTDGSPNSTLGHVVYDNGSYYPTVMERIGEGPGHSPPYTGFSCVRMGDLEGDGSEELMVAVWDTVPDTSSIDLYNATGSIAIVEGLHFYYRMEFDFDDFDDDGRDEVIYAYTSTATWPDTYISYYDWNGTAYESIFLGNTTKTQASVVSVGDVDTDGEMELLYGTESDAWLGLWDYANISFTDGYLVEPAVALVNEPFNLTYSLRLYGWDTEGLNISIDLPAELNASGQSSIVEIGDQFEPGIISVEWQITPLTHGTFDITITMSSSNAGNNTVLLAVQIKKPLNIVLLVGLIIGIVVIAATLMTLYLIKKGKFPIKRRKGSIVKEKQGKAQKQTQQVVIKQPAVVPKPTPKAAAEVSKIQKILDGLDERLALGEISEATYLQIKKKWEAKLKNQ